MIIVFFNEDGYHAAGSNVEIARRCFPALTNRGDRIFPPIHHEYKVLSLALNEFANQEVSEDVMVYGDSRIIDELNGDIEPMDETCKDWLQTINRDTLPYVRGVVFFRKKPLNEVAAAIRAAQDQMMPQMDRRIRQTMAEQEVERVETQERSRKGRILDRFKAKWLNRGDNNGE